MVDIDAVNGYKLVDCKEMDGKIEEEDGVAERKGWGNEKT